MIKPIFCTILLFACISYAGGTVGDGGDLIACKPSPKNFLNGNFSLDYVLTLPSMKSDEGLVSVSSWKASAQRIYQILLSKSPQLASSFADFKDSVFNEDDFSKKRLWEPTEYGLVDLKDEKITSRIPDNCKRRGRTLILQAAIRLDRDFSGSNRIIYKYVPSVVASLDRQNPLQLSFLLIHEWLWDISDDVNLNRKTNRLLHSKEVEFMSPEEFSRALKIQ